MSLEVIPLVVGSGALALLSSGFGIELWAESRYDLAASETASQQHRDSLYNSANTDRRLAEAIAISGLAAGVVAMWLHVHNANRDRRATTGVSARVDPTAAALTVSGRF
jgi:hypothetical protein